MDGVVFRNRKVRIVDTHHEQVSSAADYAHFGSFLANAQRLQYCVSAAKRALHISKNDGGNSPRFPKNTPMSPGRFGAPNLKSGTARNPEIIAQSAPCRVMPRP